MPTFKTGEQEWLVRLDAPTIAEVRERVGVDLADTTGQTFAKLQQDPVSLVNSLWVIVEKQALQRGVTDEQFGASLVGDPIEEATEALLNAIVDFFPRRKREILRAMLARQKRIQAKAESLTMDYATDEASEEKTLERIRGLLTQWSGATN